MQGLHPTGQLGSIVIASQGHILSLCPLSWFFVDTSTLFSWGTLLMLDALQVLCLISLPLHKQYHHAATSSCQALTKCDDGWVRVCVHTCVVAGAMFGRWCGGSASTAKLRQQNKTQGPLLNAKQLLSSSSGGALSSDVEIPLTTHNPVAPPLLHPRCVRVHVSRSGCWSAVV